MSHELKTGASSHKPNTLPTEPFLSPTFDTEFTIQFIVLLFTVETYHISSVMPTCSKSLLAFRLCEGVKFKAKGGTN